MDELEFIKRYETAGILSRSDPGHVLEAEPLYKEEKEGYLEDCMALIVNIRDRLIGQELIREDDLRKKQERAIEFKRIATINFNSKKQRAEALADRIIKQAELAGEPDPWPTMMLHQSENPLSFDSWENEERHEEWTKAQFEEQKAKFESHFPLPETVAIPEEEKRNKFGQKVKGIRHHKHTIKIQTYKEQNQLKRRLGPEKYKERLRLHEEERTEARLYGGMEDRITGPVSTFAFSMQ
jgi:hypothetical protein